VEEYRDGVGESRSSAMKLIRGAKEYSDQM
jgi:hypothetical protein